MKQQLQLNSTIAAALLGVGLIFGCTPREQTGTAQDTLAISTTTTTTSTNTTAPTGLGTSITVDDSTIKKGTTPVAQDPKPNSPTTKNSENKMIRKSITNVLEMNTHAWMEIPGVNGSGVRPR